MDLLDILELLALLLAIACVVGMVRNWNKRGPAAGNKPSVHLTAAGWLLAGATVTAVVGLLVVWFFVVRAAPGRPGRSWVYAFTGLGVLGFLAGRGALAALGVRTTWEEPPPAGGGELAEGVGLARSRRERELDTSLVGRVGVAVSPLRPSGRVAVSGIGYEAISEGTFVGAGASVRVVGVSRLTLRVRQEPAEPVAAPPPPPLPQ